MEKECNSYDSPISATLVPLLLIAAVFACMRTELDVIRGHPIRSEEVACETWTIAWSYKR